MRYWLIYVLIIGTYCDLSPAQSAQEWTEKLRIFDRYARVLTTDEWLKTQEPQPDNVTYERTGLEDRTGYIRIRTFEPISVCHDVRQAIHALKDQVDDWILDLRGNPGGQRMMAVCVAGLFVGGAEIMATQNIESPIPDLSELIDNSGFENDHHILWIRYVMAKETEHPLIIWIDAETASAAEVVAGSLQDLKRAMVVGERSFGKGMTQDCSPMRKHADLVVCYTAEKIILPSGREPEGSGITPNIIGLWSRD